MRILNNLKLSTCIKHILILNKLLIQYYKYLLKSLQNIKINKNSKQLLIINYDS